MQYMDDLEEQIDKLVRNTMGIDVIKNFSRGILSAEIIIPKDKVEKGITQCDVKYEIIIDSYSPTLYPIPKVYCLTPYCFPSLADGRDLFKELKNCGDSRKGDLVLTNLLLDLLEFMKINYERGGLIFCGNYYLDEKLESRFFNNDKCKNFANVKQNLINKKKNVALTRILILSDVHFLLFKKDKNSKTGLILLFWASFNNLEKIQKLSDNKTVLLHWTTKDKNNNYSMNLGFEHRSEFLDNLMERIKNFGMNFDISKINKQNQIEHQKFTTDFKLKNLEKEKEKEKEKENINSKNLIEEKLDDDGEDKIKEKNKKEGLEEYMDNLKINDNIYKIEKKNK